MSIKSFLISPYNRLQVGFFQIEEDFTYCRNSFGRSGQCLGGQFLRQIFDAVTEGEKISPDRRILHVDDYITNLFPQQPEVDLIGGDRAVHEAPEKVVPQEIRYCERVRGLTLLGQLEHAGPDVSRKTRAQNVRALLDYTQEWVEKHYDLTPEDVVTHEPD